MLIPILIIGKHVWDIEKNIPKSTYSITIDIQCSNVVIYIENDIKKIIKNRFGRQDIKFQDMNDLKKISGIPDEYLKIIQEYL